MTDVEPEVTLPETPTPPNGLSTTDGKLGPLAKLGNLPIAADTLSGNTQVRKRVKGHELKRGGGTMTEHFVRKCRSLDSDVDRCSALALLLY